MSRMRSRRVGTLVLAIAAGVLMGGEDCGDGEDQDALLEALARGDAAGEEGGVSLSEDGCAMLSDILPPGLAAVPDTSDLLLVADPAPAVLPFDVTTEPPSLVGPGDALPADSDGDGMDDDPAPELDGVTAPFADLALATTTMTEQVVFIDPGTGQPTALEVGGDMRSAVDTEAPVPLADVDGRNDSGGDPRTEGFDTAFTSGAAVIADRLFVSTSNIVMGGRASAEPVYAPGSALVFDFAGEPPTSIPANPSAVVLTSRYNPTDVTPYTTEDGRELVLVTSTGAVGVTTMDGVGSLRIVESASDRGRQGAIEIIDADADPPALLAVIPLGETAPGFGKLAIHPSGDVGVIGRLVGRELLAVDLTVLDDELPADPPADPENPPEIDAVIDSASLAITPLGGGPAAAVCPGSVPGVAWAADGASVFATEFCDGTLTTWDVDAADLPSVDAFSMRSETPIVAPQTPAFAGELRAPLEMVARDAAAGEPDLFVLVGLPQGFLCGLVSGAL